MAERDDQTTKAPEAFRPFVVRRVIAPGVAVARDPATAAENSSRLVAAIAATRAREDQFSS